MKWTKRGERPTGHDGEYFWMQQNVDRGEPFGVYEEDPEVIYLFGHPDDGDCCVVRGSMSPLTHKRFDDARFAGPIPMPEENDDD